MSAVLKLANGGNRLPSAIILIELHKDDTSLMQRSHCVSELLKNGMMGNIISRDE